MKSEVGIIWEEFERNHHLKKKKKERKINKHLQNLSKQMKSKKCQQKDRILVLKKNQMGILEQKTQQPKQKTKKKPLLDGFL